MDDVLLVKDLKKVNDLDRDFDRLVLSEKGQLRSLRLLPLSLDESRIVIIYPSNLNVVMLVMSIIISFIIGIRRLKLLEVDLVL